MADMIGSKISGANTQATDMLREVQNDKMKSGQTPGLSFADTLTSQAEKAADSVIKKEQSGNVKVSGEKPILKFSNHALERMNTRGISFTASQITKIEQGMQKASDKGSKETLVLTDDSALIVSLKDNTVVTVMDKNMLRENVFTNIDSTVFV